MGQGSTDCYYCQGPVLSTYHSNETGGSGVVGRSWREFCSLVRHWESANKNNVKKKAEKRVRRDELRRECDVSRLNGGVGGKYTARYWAGMNLVLLSPDVAEYFPDEKSVNNALRALIPAAKDTVRRALRRSHSRRKSQKPHPLKIQMLKGAPSAVNFLPAVRLGPSRKQGKKQNTR